MASYSSAGRSKWTDTTRVVAAVALNRLVIMVQAAVVVPIRREREMVAQARLAKAMRAATARLQNLLQGAAVQKKQAVIHPQSLLAREEKVLRPTSSLMKRVRRLHMLAVALVVAQTH